MPTRKARNSAAVDAVDENIDENIDDTSNGSPERVAQPNEAVADDQEELDTVPPKRLAPQQNASEADMQTFGDAPGRAAGEESGIANPSEDPDATFIQSGQSDAEQTLLTSADANDAAGSDAADGGSMLDEDDPLAGLGDDEFGSGQSGRYELLDNFARGGLGNIWRARDNAIRRDVAYKELRPGATMANPQAEERFLEEAQITGQLEHPCIVPIYDLGVQDDESPFYAMKLVHGDTLEIAIKDCHAFPANSVERKLAFTKLLRHFIDICNGMGFAHDHGVLHRDLKPLNVMIGAFGETLILDWGLAKLIPTEAIHANSDGFPTSEETVVQKEIATVAEHAGAVRDADDGATAITAPDAASPAPVASAAPSQILGSLAGQTHGGETGTHGRTVGSSVTTNARSEGTETVMGQIMGTPAYMPPEQALGLVDELDPRSDIYSLGGILYKILTGLQPVPRGNVTDVLESVKKGEVIPPRTHDAKIPKALEAICLKALAKEKADRYKTAMLLCADIEAWLADEPISAYTEPWYVRLRRWTRRHRTLVATLAAVGVVAVTGLSAWNIHENRRIAGNRQGAQRKIVQAEAAVHNERFSEARQLLGEANGIVKSEPSLSRGDSDIKGRLQIVLKFRVAAVKAAAEKKLAAADSDVELNDDYNAAKSRLREVVASLKDEPQLAKLRAAAEENLNTVNAAIGNLQAQAAARQEFERFLDLVDQARFYGSLFTGDNVEDDSREARENAFAALKMYGLEKPVALDAPPQHLSEDVKWVREYRSRTGKLPVETIRSDAFELKLILAETEEILARGEDDPKPFEVTKRALEWIEAAKQLGIKSQSLYLRETAYLDRLGRVKERDEAARLAETITPSTALDFFLLAEAKRKMRAFDQALALYQAALRVDPNHFWSMNFMGLCHLQLDHPDAAVASYTACIARRAEFPWNYLTRGFAYAGLKQYDNALRDFQRAEQLKPELYGISLNRGSVYVLQKQYEKAVAEFQRAIQLRPDRADPHINMAETYRQQADQLRQNDDLLKAQPLFEKALNELTIAAELAPANPKIYQMRGDVNMRLDATEVALRDFQRAIDLGTSTNRVAECFKQIGQIHHREGRLQPALVAYQQSAKLNSTDAEVIRLQADVLKALGRNQEAIAAFSKFLELSGPAGDVYRDRGIMRSKLGEIRDAITDYTRSLEVEPSVDVLRSRGWAYLINAKQLNVYTLALADFENATKSEPNNPDNYNGRGYANVQLGNYRDAVLDAEKAAKLTSEGSLDSRVQIWMFYNAATIYAQAVRQADNDAKLTAEKKSDLTNSFTNRAVALIVQAIRVAGRNNQAIVLKTMQSDAALDPIRSRPEFQAVFKMTNAK